MYALRGIWGLHVHVYTYVSSEHYSCLNGPSGTELNAPIMGDILILNLIDVRPTASKMASFVQF